MLVTLNWHCVTLGKSLALKRRDLFGVMASEVYVMSSWQHFIYLYFWAVVRQNLMVEGRGRSKVRTPRCSGSREKRAVKARLRSAKGMTPVTYVLQLGSAS